MTDKKFFTENLIKWNETENSRQMPWKGETDPYRIWISEIILQQTRVQQGLEYYNRFIAAFPAIQDIAHASEQKVFKLWEGLGYYTRCRNIISTARYISGELNGKFPASYEEILKLKGIGSYTASAIASFAYKLPHAVVDGNVYRVLSRFFGVDVPVDSNEGKKVFTQLANELLDKKDPGIYNQAIMDFGAVVCKPQPVCSVCPLNSRCVAYNKELVDILPIKNKNIIRKNRWMYYLVIEHNKKFYVQKRMRKDIWKDLYEFVLIETAGRVSINRLKTLGAFKNIFNTSKFQIESISGIHKQQLTHQNISGRFIKINLDMPIRMNGFKLVSKNELDRLPFPKFITTYMKE